MNSETKGFTSAEHAAVPLKRVPGVGETGGRVGHNVWIKYPDSIHNVRAYYPLPVVAYGMRGQCSLIRCADATLHSGVKEQ